MATREMIVAGYVGRDAEEQVDPFLRGLLGQFTDEMSEADKLLFEYANTKGLPDLYFAIYDTQTHTLTAPEGDGRGAMVCFGYEPKSKAQWQRLREALSVALELGMSIDTEVQ